MATATIQPTPFPAASKSASGVVNNTLTTVTSTSFSDKILLTVTSPASSNKLAHWVHVPLAPSANTMDPSFLSTSASGNPDTSLLPRTNLTATTVLGGTKREEEVIGQTLATTIATAILMKRPTEERMLVLASGLQGVLEKEGFEQVVGLMLRVL
ncbi:hypothetical protein BDY17DRAFT_328378 [Neohortaea acidophila]|uniref:Proteasome assembly chaperone 3 n=1 Tax=Neohortaea acidophila TaxID=245834 RepID=A0A6A6PHX4_9PEZI|nr:uncharacterized protein BDY17DRAFT_328378 [Neohortaea acidophila]KAF2478867.1 hypothetical protein BDY17DRAFT_328378 [Neohortaea acidophila]